jgi:hypothetical protein
MEPFSFTILNPFLSLGNILFAQSDGQMAPQLSVLFGKERRMQGLLGSLLLDDSFYS